MCKGNAQARVGGGGYVNDIQKSAYEDYINGMKYVDISAKYNVTIDTVKSWYKRHWKEKKCAPDDAKKVHPKGQGAPERNQNAVTHGAYRKVFNDSLDDDETGLIDDFEIDHEKSLEDSLRNLTISERRLMKQVKQYMQGNENGKKLVLDGGTKTTGSNGGDKVRKFEEIRTTAAFNHMRIVQAELTKVQRAKIKCAVDLAQERARKYKDGEFSKPETQEKKVVINFDIKRAERNSD